MTSFGHQHSLLGHPVPAGELGPPHGRLTEPQVRTPTGLPRSARTSSDRGGRPLYPGDGGAHPDRRRLPAGACRFAAASPCTPPHFPSTGFSLNEASTRVQASLPRACGRPDGTGCPWASPRLRTPPTRSRRRTPGSGTGHRARTWNYTLNITSVDLQSGSSLDTCDIASHVAIAMARLAQAQASKRSPQRLGRLDRVRGQAVSPRGTGQSVFPRDRNRRTGVVGMAKGIVREASAPARIEAPAGQRVAGWTRGSSPVYPSASTFSSWWVSSSAQGVGDQVLQKPILSRG